MQLVGRAASAWRTVESVVHDSGDSGGKSAIFKRHGNVQIFTVNQRQQVEIGQFIVLGGEVDGLSRHGGQREIQHSKNE